MPGLVSKFKYISGPTASRNEEIFTDLGKFNLQGDSSYCSASTKFVAAHMESGGGQICVMVRGKTGRKNNYKCATYNMGAVTISEWSPHSDRMMASGDSNGSCFVHFYDDDLFDNDGMLKEKVTEATQQINTKFVKPIVGLKWHPSISNLLVLSGKDRIIRFFDVTTGEPVEDFADIETKDVPHSIDFSWNGELMCYVEKSGTNHTLVVYNIRTGKECWRKPTKMKNVQSCFMNTDDYKYVFVVGSDSGGSKRFFKVYDQESGDQINKDWNLPEKSNGQVMPTWDSGRGIMWYFTKGDLTISQAIWRVDKKQFHSIGGYRSMKGTDGWPVRGGCFVPQRGMDVLSCEVGEFVALRNKRSANEIAPIPFKVPRRKEGFFAELYPDVPSAKPVCKIEEFVAGQTFEKPNFMSMDPDAAGDGGDDDAVFEKKLSYADISKNYETLLQIVRDNADKFQGVDLSMFGIET